MLRYFTALCVAVALVAVAVAGWAYATQGTTQAHATRAAVLARY